MRRLAAAALALAIGLPACAQRGRGGHAGFTARGTPAGRSAPTLHGFGGPAYGARRLPAPGLRYPARPPIHRPTFYRGGNHRFVVRSYPYYGFGFYPSAVYLPYSGFYDDSFDNDDIAQPPAPDSSYPAPDAGYPQPMPEYGYAYPQPTPAYPVSPQPAPATPYPDPAPNPGYVPQAAPAAPQMQNVPGSSESVILIYKDGRPPEQIQNYLATRTTLTILDGGRPRVVPLADLDLPATISANRQTGVDFRLPTAKP